MLDRRNLLIGAGALPAAGMALARAAPVSAAAVTEPNGTTTDQFIRFATSLRYEALPADVVVAAKRCLIDALGCGLAGWGSRKGNLAAATMTRLGGPAEASLWGGKARVSTTNAAFANAELMNGLDFDAIPHIPPVIVPALMALAEARHTSGKDFLLALVVAYEIAGRLSAASSQMGSAILATGTTPEVFGINQESIMAAAAGCARLIGLSPDATASAFGLAGYYCPPQSSHDWETGSPKSNVKYVPVGWINQGAVTAALLAESGYTGNPRVLDGAAGFARFYGWERWDVAVATRGLGDQWRILTADYKPYAVCRYVHSRIDALKDVIETHDIRPDAIESIHSLGPVFVANPDQMTIRTQEDAQFSVPYALALVALRIPLDAHCQSEALLRDPKVRAMMAKVKWDTHPRTAETKRADPRSFIASAELTAGGRRFSGETMFARGNGSVPEMRTTDAALDAKFLANATISLPKPAAEALLARLRTLEAAPDMTAVARGLMA